MVLMSAHFSTIAHGRSDCMIVKTKPAHSDHIKRQQNFRRDVFNPAWKFAQRFLLQSFISTSAGVFRAWIMFEKAMGSFLYGQLVRTAVGGC